MNDSEALNFRELERELANAVAADQKYQRENDAKFRASHQKVASYEEFRDIVLASNLKPLERKDKIGGDRKQPWNATASTNSSSRESACTMLQEALSEPKNAFEFTRYWSRIDVKERYDFLVHFGAKKLSCIFQMEVPSGLVGEFLFVLEENFQSVHLEEVMVILQCLAETQRFHLSLLFLSDLEKERCKELFVKLQNAVNDKKETCVERNLELKQIMALYKISI
ncbi:coiled-coil domain-containing protein 103 [Pseudophryne corroboree]|uniref:coiled-coil domain-containing protein 103 n=1 Tax=Pseudophryne corroboree TaxID=495146 RepID=UPI0030815FD0